MNRTDAQKAARSETLAVAERRMSGTKPEATVDEALPADVPVEVMQEQAYLIARGVRPMAVLGHCEARPLRMLKIATVLENIGSGGCVPFVFDRGDGLADFGFASSPWAMDLYAWVVRSGVPEKQRARIVGLLLGYGVQAIQAFEDQTSGRLFVSPIGSDE